MVISGFKSDILYIFFKILLSISNLSPRYVLINLPSTYPSIMYTSSLQVAIQFFIFVISHNLNGCDSIILIDS